MSLAGKLLFNLYYRPVGQIRSSLRHGGPWTVRETERQRQMMEQAAPRLGPLPQFPDRPPVQLYFVTGRRFWYQTAFCLHTFAQHGERTIAAEIYDDGTIRDDIRDQLAALGPTVRIHPFTEILGRLDEHLPAKRFPTLRERWLNYPNIRKLIDVHLGSVGPKLVLDSDLLFFREPSILLKWHDQPAGSLTAIDFTESYGYSRPLMEELARGTIPPLVNVGICGLDSSLLDWEELEFWCTRLIERERTNYYLEQAIVAMYTAREKTRTIAPASDYVTMPGQAEVMRPKAIMHHYVDTSKRWYFRYGWRNAVPRVA